MRTVGRILIILLAAAIVIGGAYALLQSSAAQTLVGQPIGQGGFEGQAGPPDFVNGQGAPLGEGRGEREGQGGSWMTFVQNFLEIAAVIVVVQVAWTIGRRIKRLAEKNHRLQVSRSS
jgi:large-conductance mechanosensitive channel